MPFSKSSQVWQNVATALSYPTSLIHSNVHTNIEATAAIQLPSQPRGPLAIDGTDSDDISEPCGLDLEKGEKEPSRKAMRSFASNIFDRITALAGTIAVFLLVLIGLLGWMVIGIVLGPSQAWQIALQNISSIQCYVSDTLLMRQQRNNSRDLLTWICQLRSRNVSCKRLLLQQQSLHQVYSKIGENKSQRAAVVQVVDAQSAAKESCNSLEFGVYLPAQGLYDRICDPIVTAVGSVYAFFFYWSGIVVWMAMGSALKWSNLWQLYINTATAVEITFVSVFLQNTRQRHMNYLDECFKLITEEDQRMERLLRQITGDTLPNQTVALQYDYRHLTTWGNRAVDYYAAIVGSGAGLVISTLVFSVWLAVGHPMHWSSNWWLIIGTYTGLVGFIDGFALRNVYFRSAGVIDSEFQTLLHEDAVLFELLGLKSPPELQTIEKRSFLDRIGHAVGNICSRSAAVLISCLTVVVVLAIATGMKWSETGQLICNTPTMIVEGFLLLVLIQAHDVTSRSRRLQFQRILTRRLAINSQLVRLVVGDFQTCPDVGVDLKMPEEKLK